MDNSWSDVMKKLPSYCFVIVLLAGGCCRRRHIHLSQRSWLADLLPQEGDGFASQRTWAVDRAAIWGFCSKIHSYNRDFNFSNFSGPITCLSIYLFFLS